jgi:hypothetical protein
MLNICLLKLFNSSLKEVDIFVFLHDFRVLCFVAFIHETIITTNLVGQVCRVGQNQTSSEGQVHFLALKFSVEVTLSVDELKQLY